MKYFMTFVLGCLVGGLAVIGVQKMPLTNKDSLPPRADQAPQSTDKGLDLLRQKASEIQAQWDKLAKREELESRLQNLRAELLKQRKTIESTSHEAWEKLVERTDSLIDQAKSKEIIVPKEIADIKKMINDLSKHRGDEENQNNDLETSDTETVNPSSNYQIGR